MRRDGICPKCNTQPRALKRDYCLRCDRLRLSKIAKAWRERNPHKLAERNERRRKAKQDALQTL